MESTLMQTKLTLRLDDALIRKAKRHSVAAGKSVSQLVADYFSLIEVTGAPEDEALTPRVRALFGALKGARVSEREARRHRELKHR
jgi:hypothetical protein